MAHFRIQTKSCKLCRKRHWAAENDLSEVAKRMIDNRWCFECAYWKDIVENPPSNMYVVEGYVMAGNSQPFGRAVRECLLHQPLHLLEGENKLVKLDRYVLLGKPPKRFRKFLPDTAIALTKGIFGKLDRNFFHCQSKGCLDRYRCLRYQKAAKEETSAWNTIPKNYIIGTEKCVSFIDTKTLPSVKSIIDNILQ